MVLWNVGRSQDPASHASLHREIAEPHVTHAPLLAAFTLVSDYA